MVAEPGRPPEKQITIPFPYSLFAAWQVQHLRELAPPVIQA
jgi:hypothetical protein